MGLDMYINKKKYIGYDSTVIINVIDDKDKSIIQKTYNHVDYIIQEVGYWRKVNWVHKWFVDNIQDGKDDCKEYKITIDNLLELKDICTKILENHDLANELLPPCPGFFFGSCDVNDYYFESLNNTIEIIDKIIDEYDENTDTLYYESSW